MSSRAPQEVSAGTNSRSQRAEPHRGPARLAGRRSSGGGGLLLRHGNQAASGVAVSSQKLSVAVACACEETPCAGDGGIRAPSPGAVVARHQRGLPRNSPVTAREGRLVVRRSRRRPGRREQISPSASRRQPAPDELPGCSAEPAPRVVMPGPGRGSGAASRRRASSGASRSAEYPEQTRQSWCRRQGSCNQRRRFQAGAEGLAPDALGGLLCVPGARSRPPGCSPRIMLEVRWPTCVHRTTHAPAPAAANLEPGAGAEGEVPPRRDARGSPGGGLGQPASASPEVTPEHAQHAGRSVSYPPPLFAACRRAPTCRVASVDSQPWRGPGEGLRHALEFAVRPAPFRSRTEPSQRAVTRSREGWYTRSSLARTSCGAAALLVSGPQRHRRYDGATAARRKSRGVASARRRRHQSWRRRGCSSLSRQLEEVLDSGQLSSWSRARPGADLKVPRSGQPQEGRARRGGELQRRPIDRRIG